MNVLCIGGPADGRRVVLPEGKMHYEVVKTQRVDLSQVLSTEPFVAETYHYNLFHIHPVTRATVFALESLTPTEVMEMLMDGYRVEKVR